MDRYAVELNSQDAAKALDAVSPDFDILFSEFGDHQAGVAGRLIFAQMNYRAGRMAPAVEQYEAALGQFPEGSFRASAAWSGLGYAQAGAGEHEKALAAFSKTVAGADPVLKADALYQMALLYRKMGEEGQYRKTLETLKNDYPESIYADILPSATAGS
jgi:tetratricopeptide (TPR) repeat protein